VVKVLRLAARAAAPWLRLITETNVPHHEGISYFGNGDEADWVYAFPLPPLIVHALTSADAGPLTAWIASLEAPPAGSALFNILATHDGLGLNGASGLLGTAEIDRLVRLGERCGAVSFRTESTGADRPYELNANLLDLLGEVHPESALPERAISRLVSAHAMQLALAGIPALYFHSLFGSRGDAAAVLRTGVPRAVNRERLDRSRLEAELHREGSRRRKIFEALSRLIRARQGLPALHPQAPQLALDLGPHIFGLERTSIDGRQLVICLHEVAGVADRIRLRSGVGHDVLAGEDIPLSGIPLAPYQTRWMRVVP
jgi:sucrose phosphorylase